MILRAHYRIYTIAFGVLPLPFGTKKD